MNIDSTSDRYDQSNYYETSDVGEAAMWDDGLVSGAIRDAMAPGNNVDELDDDIGDIQTAPYGASEGRTDSTGEVAEPATPVTRVVMRSNVERPLRIKATRERTDSDDTEYDRPRAGSVVAAAKRGATLRYELSRDEDGGPIKIVVSPALKPPEADVEEVDSQAAYSDPWDDDDHDPQQQELWVRFQRHDIPPTDESKDTPDTSDETPLDVKDLLEGYDGKFRLVIQAKGVPRGSEEYQRIYKEAKDAAHNASIFRGQDLEEGIRTARLQKIAKAAGTALVQVEVAVTAPEEALPYVAELVEGVLPANRRSTWAAERTGEDLVGYTSEQSAIQTGRSDPASYEEARDFRDSITFPDIETEGYQRVRRQNLSVEQELPPGTHAFRIGERLDNLFTRSGMRRVAGELLLPVKDLLRHTLVIGRTNSGKTEFVRQLLTNAKLDNFQRRESGEDVPELKVVTIDFKKGGNESNYGQPLADRFAGAGLPPEMATVNRIRPGGGGLRPILDLCDPKNSTAARQAERIINSVLIGVSSGVGAGMSGADGETQRILERYIKDGVIAAYTEMGWNMDDDQTDYPDGTLPHPTMGLIAHKIREVFDEKSYDDKAKGNLSEFNAGQFENQLKLLPGRFFRDGHPIDFQEVVNSQGITAFEFDELGSNDTARKVAAVGIIQEIEKVIDARHQALGIGEVDEIEVLIALDEAAKIFDMTPAGETTSEFLTRLRSKGIGFVISQQLAEGMNPTALKNIGNVLVMQSSEAELLAENKLMGDASVDELAFLNSKEVKMTRGTGLAYVTGVNGPVRFRSVRVKDLPPGTGRVDDARALVNLGPYNKHYTGEAIGRAGRFLNERRAGNLITAWAEFNTALVLGGRQPSQAAGRFLEALTAMTDTDMRDVAIIEAVRNAVDARFETTHLMPPDPRERLTTYLIDRMIKQVRGEKVRNIEVRFDLCLDHGYYARVEDIVENALTADRLGNTEHYETYLGNLANKVIGSTVQNIEISGPTAAEQKSNLERLDRESIRAIRDAVVAGAERTMSKAEIQQAQLALARLIGVSTNGQAVAHVLEKLRLKHDQMRVFEEILSGLPDDLLAAEGAVDRCIYAMYRALDKAIEYKRENTPAIDLRKWTKIYGGQDFSVPSGLAKDQQALIEMLKKERLANCDYAEDVAEVDLLIAPDLRNGGLALDNAVAALANRDRLQGRLYRKARRTLNDDKEERLTIVDLAKEMKVDNWAGVAGHEIVYGQPPNFLHTTGSKRSLARQINNHVRELREMGTQARIKQKQEGPKKV